MQYVAPRWWLASDEANFSSPGVGRPVDGGGLVNINEALALAVVLTHTTSRDHRTFAGSSFLTEILRVWPTQNFPVSTAQFWVRASRNWLSDGTRYWYVRFACLPILSSEPMAPVLLEEAVLLVGNKGRLKLSIVHGQVKVVDRLRYEQPDDGDQYSDDAPHVSRALVVLCQRVEDREFP